MAVTVYHNCLEKEGEIKAPHYFDGIYGLFNAVVMRFNTYKKSINN